MGEALWLVDNRNRSWVVAELAAIAPRTIQLDTFSWNRKLARVFTHIPSRGVVTWNAMIFGHIVQSRCESDVFVGSSLVDMYAKCGSMEDAARVFNKMPSRNVVLWNMMISGHVKCGQGDKALELFGQMQQEHVQPDPVTLVAVLNACASVAALEEGRVFNKMPSCDAVTWNVMISGLVKCGQGQKGQKALELFQQMQQGRCGARFCHVSGGAECMRKYSCT
ncbi:unnamed protein product [Sphagnum jensenii]|uniref:Pentatricopeptide repeat-containing protein n=1 Tax=Sphagnum jensenii TaxID=128206 RepID=A0ABP0WM63_9BRYO